MVGRFGTYTYIPLINLLCKQQKALNVDNILIHYLNNIGHRQAEDYIYLRSAKIFILYITFEGNSQVDPFSIFIEDAI